MLHALLTHLRRLYQAAALAALVGGLPLVLASADGARMEEIARTRYGEAVAASVRDWRALLVDPAIVDERERLSRVNAFFNRRLRFDDDINIWKEADYWATPLEMFAQGQGDCEDYAIGKYFALMAAGVPQAKLRLVYVRATLGGVGGVQQAHMVLAYYPAPTAEPLILDNLIGDIRPASRRPDLQPVFSFNADGLWQGTQGPGAGDPTARLSRWREVLIKAREQGLF